MLVYQRKAFTLVEMVVTLVVLSTVMGLGYFGLNAVAARQERAMSLGQIQSVVELERRYAALNDEYTPSPAELKPIPAGVVVVADAVSDTGQVSIAVGSNGTLTAAAILRDGTCRGVRVPALKGSGAKSEQSTSVLNANVVCDARAFLPPGEWASSPGAPSDATLALLATTYSSGQTWANSGQALTTLDAQLGAANTVDTQDPTWLPYTGDTYAYIPFGVGNYLSTADAPLLRPSTVFDMQVQVALDDWAAPNDVVLVSKWATPSVVGQQAYVFGISGPSSDRRLFLKLSATGTTAQISTASVPLPEFAVGQQQWLRSTWDATLQQTQFFRAADGTNWTKVGDPIPTSIATIFPGTAQTAVGTLSGFDSAGLGGKLFAIRASFTPGTTAVALGTSMCAQYSCESTTGEIWDVQRAAQGFPTAIVDRPMFLLGNGSFIQIPDNAALDLSSGADRTVVLVGRFHSLVANGNPQVVSKRPTSSTVACSTGWSIALSAAATPTARNVVAQSACEYSSAPFTVQGGTPLALGFQRSTAGGTISSFVGADAVSLQTRYSTVAGVTALDASNSLPVRIGVTANSVLDAASFELFGFAVYERALSAQEIAAVATYLGA